jgi:hypothetical protein
MNTCTVFNFQFLTSIQMSEPEQVGLDAMDMHFPHDADFQNRKLSVMFVLYPQMAKEAMQMSNEEFLEYAKVTFFGSGGSAESSKTRTIFGKSVETQIIHKIIPATSVLEVGIVPLSNGDAIVLGFDMKEGLSFDEYEKTITEITESLKEV